MNIVQSRQPAEELLAALALQAPGEVLANPVKHLIRAAVQAGVSIETIVLLLLLPIVATLIATARHLIGIRGFGIFLPAALSVVFLAIGPVVGVALFLLIVALSTFFRLLTRKLKLKLQYLPRMALTLWVVAIGILGILFAAAYIPQVRIPQVSLFPVLIMILLSEDFVKVQLGKSLAVAISLVSQTFILGLLSFGVLSLAAVQEWVITNPEAALGLPLVVNIFLARYVGLRLLELWRFRKLIAK